MSDLQKSERYILRVFNDIAIRSSHSTLARFTVGNFKNQMKLLPLERLSFTQLRQTVFILNFENLLACFNKYFAWNALLALHSKEFDLISRAQNATFA